MNLSHKWLFGAALSSLLLVGCVSKVTEKEQYSGFLPNYDNLQETTSAGGAPVKRWVAPSFNPNAYSTVVFRGLALYPAPKPDERVNLKTLQDLQAYTTASAKSVLSQKYRVVPSLQSAPNGSRTLVMNAAITGVTASNEGMKWYEIVPIAAVNAAAGALIGYRDQNTELYIEADLVDAGTGQPVVKVVRKVFGATLENNSQKITENDFKAAIKAMANDMQALLK
ncbi:MAG: hypothetical protein JWP80_713 [Pseudomonas sp.]|nr:hypothetical protein [Pseudomonas sp.]